MILTEQSHIAEFNIYPDGKIGVKKVIDIFRDGVAIARTPWRRPCCTTARKAVA